MLVFVIWSEMAAAFSETTVLMLYMFMKMETEFARMFRMFSFRMVLARDIAAAFPETAVFMVEMASEFLLMLSLFSCRMLLVLAIFSDIAAAFAETAASMLDMLVEMLIMLTEAIVSSTVIFFTLSATVMLRALMSSSLSSRSPFKASKSALAYVETV